VQELADLPPSRLVLFDTSPDQVASIATPALPTTYVRRLRRFRYGPGIFKIDWALDGPIPWDDPACLDAATVHVGGTLDEIAAAEAQVWRGEHAERPFTIVVQPSLFDPSRAPAGKHTGWAYCHVPSGSTLDRTEVIERQIERFAPGFRDRILARHVRSVAAMESYNANYVRGDVVTGSNDGRQLVFRPRAALDPYALGIPGVFLCSAATPPGAGAHGMCGYNAAQSALRALGHPRQGTSEPVCVTAS
jgi:phytoene dehydrogenase-like protein